MYQQGQGLYGFGQSELEAAASTPMSPAPPGYTPFGPMPNPINIAESVVADVQIGIGLGAMFVGVNEEELGLALGGGTDTCLP